MNIPHDNEITEATVYDNLVDVIFDAEYLSDLKEAIGETDKARKIAEASILIDKARLLLLNTLSKSN